MVTFMVHVLEAGGPPMSSTTFWKKKKKNISQTYESYTDEKDVQVNISVMKMITSSFKVS